MQNRAFIASSAMNSLFPLTILLSRNKLREAKTPGKYYHGRHGKD